MLCTFLFKIWEVDYVFSVCLLINEIKWNNQMIAWFHLLLSLFEGYKIVRECIMAGLMVGLIGHYKDPLVSLSLSYLLYGKADARTDRPLWGSPSVFASILVFLSLSLSYVYHGRTNAGTNRPLWESPSHAHLSNRSNTFISLNPFCLFLVRRGCRGSV